MAEIAERLCQRKQPAVCFTKSLPPLWFSYWSLNLDNWYWQSRCFQIKLVTSSMFCDAYTRLCSSMHVWPELFLIAILCIGVATVLDTLYFLLLIESITLKSISFDRTEVAYYSNGKGNEALVHGESGLLQ